MTGAGSVEYAHARIWARHGQRPDEALWRRMEATREFAAVLELARGSALAGWLECVSAGASLHAIEAAVRRHWRERVAEVASWMPGNWGPSIEWCAVLADLPALQHLARGAAPPAWMTRDPDLRLLLEGHAAGEPALRALLDSAQADPGQLLALWRVEWQQRLPHGDGRRDLEARLLPLLAAHAAAFAAPQAVDGWAMRRALQGRLVLLLRQTLVQPVTAFIYLALSALDVERLRGELLRRRAFPQRWVTA